MGEQDNHTFGPERGVISIFELNGAYTQLLEFDILGIRVMRCEWLLSPETVAMLDYSQSCRSVIQ